MELAELPQPESRKRGLALKVNYNDGGAVGGLIGYRASAPTAS